MPSCSEAVGHDLRWRIHSLRAIYYPMSDALFEMPEQPAQKSAYRVLARKYRPSNFTEMVGQDALVKTLSNAFSSGRIAHAFMLTGVRGVGKTTTARIIAKGLNCVDGPTITPCGKCDACVSIAEGRNVDVLEMDAASHTGVEGIRQLLDNVKYAPTSVRTKIYIIDEVHMLSNSSFNALLKTLEEPPPHVKFIMATTEIRKVPITVLSRCQRYDLRRIDAELLAAHFAEVAKLEAIEIDDEALRLLARAADGSARDGLSLMDQAIARGGASVTGDQVRDMLGLADRSLVFDLLTNALSGEPAKALELIATLHRDGADPLTLLQDLLDVTHQITRHKVLPARKGDVTLTGAEQKRMSELASGLSTPVLARAWQVLLKGVPEVQGASMPMAALEMLIIRLAHVGTLPTPGDLVKKLTDGSLPSGAAQPTSQGAPSGAPAMRAAVGMSNTIAVAQPAVQTQAMVHDWRSAVALFYEKKEMMLAAQLHSTVECLSFAPGQLELYPRSGTGPQVLSRVATLLQEYTGQRWLVNIAKRGGVPTLGDEDDAAARQVLKEAAEHPLVKAVLLAFPGAKIEAVRDKVLPEVEGSEDSPTLTPDEDA